MAAASEDPGGRRSKRIRIVIVDDHLLVRQGLAICLGREPGLEVVGGASSSAEALRLVEQEWPDVVLMDVSLGEESGIDLTRQLRQTHPNPRILAVTGLTDDIVVGEMLRAGADGYVIKGMAIEELAQAIHAVALGQFVLHYRVAGRWTVPSCRKTPRRSGIHLTPREVEVLQLMSDGATSREIGSRLSLSANTAGNYRTRILTKIGVHKTVEAIAWAIDEGVICPPNRQPTCALSATPSLRLRAGAMTSEC